MDSIAFWISLISGVIAVVTFLMKITPLLFIIAGWNFKIVLVELDKNLVFQGDEITIRVIIQNTGYRTLGTCYVIIKIAYAYNHKNPVLDTHRDLSLEEKSKLRIVDIVKGETKDWVFNWKVPLELPIGVYDVRVEIWSPPFLYEARGQRCFDKTKWNKHIEVRRKC